MPSNLGYRGAAGKAEESTHLIYQMRSAVMLEAYTDADIEMLVEIEQAV